MYSIPQREDGTLGKVLGKDNPYGGMRREDFFDEIQVKIVYTSLYACTSFVTGQAMNAFFRGSDPPVPASAGLGFSAAFSVSECGTPMSNPTTTCHPKRNLKHVPASDCAFVLA
ncbi:hypothetical protein WG66_013654 [Moniliophthora roreri]|nr:hypothetical protein WG66_013654 [Moniliophthora roreri]